MGRVRRAGREIGKVRAVGSDGFLLANPRDAFVGKVDRELITLVGALGRVHGRRVADQRRVELIRLTADEAVEVIEALIRRPVVERTRRARLIVGNVVILSEPRARVAVLLEQFRDGCASFRDDATVAGEAGGHLLDDAGRDRVMVASRQHRSARRRAQCRGVKLVVEQTVLGQFLSRRHTHEAAVRTWPAEADVVEQHEQNIRRALWRGLGRRKVGRRIDRIGLDLRVRKIPLGHRQIETVLTQRKRLLIHENPFDGMDGPRPKRTRHDVPSGICKSFEGVLL